MIGDTFMQESYRKVVIKTRPCGEDEISPYSFEFKGKIIDDRLEGPGRLKLKPISRKEKAKRVQVCFDLLANDIVEIIGTFKNGVLHGPGKLIKKDGSIRISHFKSGGFSGFIRDFDADGILKTIQYKDIHFKGSAWHLSSNQKYLVHKLQSGLYIPLKYDFNVIAIPLNETEQVYVGLDLPHLNLMTNVHTISSLSISNTEASCVPELKWKENKKEDFDLRYFTYEKIMHFGPNQQLCRANQTKEDVGVETRFNNFVDYMSSFLTEADKGLSLLYHLEPETSSVEPEKVKQPFMSNLTLFGDPSNRLIKLNMSVWNGPICTWTADSLGLDDNLMLNGYATLTIETQYLNRSGSHDFLNWGASQIAGTFVNGKLEGTTAIITWKGQILMAQFKNGIMHGPAFLSGQVPILDMEARGFSFSSRGGGLSMLQPHEGTGFIGRFKNGQIAGHFWVGMLKNGWLHGKADVNGLITGNDIAYIYPDGETSFRGRFEDKFMRKAFNVDVLEYGCDEHGLLMVTEFSPPLSDDIFTYDPCTNESFGGGLPLEIRDPYEVKTVKLDTSSVPNSGEGVFLIRDVPAYRFACMYSLFLYRQPDQTKVYQDKCTYNTSKSDDYRRACKKYSLGISYYGGLIDIPPELDVNPLPNLGPKVNHHFRKKNSAYSEIEHPRWGHIQSVTLLQDLKAGDELFTYYGYERGGGKPEFPADFPWYYETKMSLDREDRLKQEANKDSATNKTKKKKKKKSKA